MRRLRKDSKLYGKLEDAIGLYEDGKSPYEIADIYSLDPSNVYRLLKSASVKMRNKGEGVRNSFKTGRSKIRKAENNPAWRGGKINHQKGYILIKNPEHHREGKR